MPEADPKGNSPTRTRWEDAADDLMEIGLAPPGDEHRSALGTPLSDKENVYTALGVSIMTAKDNRFGSHEVVRLTRIALVPVASRQLISARHRDGWVWLEPIDGDAEEVLRQAVLHKRHPYGATSLLANIQTAGRVTGATLAQDLAVEVVLATTHSYPRTVLDGLNRLLGDAEEQFAAFDLGQGIENGDHSRTASSLLHLIAMVGRIERELRLAGDDFRNRVTASRIEGPAVELAETNFDRTLAGLARIRGDARTTVDMIGSTLASAHLEIARRESKEAALQRERQEAAERTQRDREQRLVGAVALLTSALLIPTLVASVFGANVKLPREGSVWQTWFMLASMVGLGSLSYAVLSEFDPTRGTPRLLVRITSYATAALFLVAAAVIAMGGCGTG
jgi:hypothetical protein